MPDESELIATAKLLREAASFIEERHDSGLSWRLIGQLRGRANLLDPASATPIPPCP